MINLFTSVLSRCFQNHELNNKNLNGMFFFLWGLYKPLFLIYSIVSPQLVFHFCAQNRYIWRMGNNINKATNIDVEHWWLHSVNPNIVNPHLHLPSMTLTPGDVSCPIPRVLQLDITSSSELKWLNK
jgi:hypothetical protein